MCCLLRHAHGPIVSAVARSVLVARLRLQDFVVGLAGGAGLVPLFVVTSLFTLSTGPGQIWFTWKLADPQLKKHPAWFWFYVLTSTLFYAGLKNAWGRIAHLKEARGETAWIVTPRVRKK